MDWKNRIIGESLEAPEHLLANPLNFRRHPNVQQEAMKGALDELGWIQRVIVNQRSGHIIDGHLRIELALQNHQRIPVLYVDLSEEEEKLALATFDPLSAMAMADKATLSRLLDETHTENAALQRMLDELADAQGLADDPTEAMEEEDEVPEVQEAVVTQPGDIWILGRHRLKCGDSTDREAVARLVSGEVDVCITDPPYGIGNSPSEKNDYHSYEDSAENLLETIKGFLPIARDLAKVTVMTCGVKNHFMYPKPSWVMAWFTPAGTGRGPWGFCCWQPILCYGKDPKLSTGQGSHPDALVHTEASQDLDHPCPKPIEFWKWLVRRVSETGQTLYDPFGGSGTTVIAAEALERTAYLMELDPRYCDVIVRRWQEFTGKPAVLEANGKPFDVIKVINSGLEK